MLGAYISLVGQAEVYPSCMIVGGSGIGIKYIVVLEFAPEVINCAIVLVVVVVFALVVVLVLILPFSVVAAPPPDCLPSTSMECV